MKGKNWVERLFLSSFKPYLWIIIIGFAIYARGLFFNFVYFDDDKFIIDNFRYINNLSNIPGAFWLKIPPAPTYYRPLHTISFILDAQLGGTKPFFYHFSNIIFHLVASGLLFLFLVKLKYRKGIALLFSLIFTIHPVLTYTILWIPGRDDSLMTIFFLASFLFFLSYLEVRKRIFFVFHLLFFTLALFSKELAILLPFMVLSYLYLIVKERFFSLNKKIFLLGWGAIIGVWFLLRQSVTDNFVDLSIFKISSLLFFYPRAILLYLGKVLLPFNLSVIPTLSDSSSIYGLLTLIIIFFALVFSRNKRIGFVIFGALWFFVLLVPSFIFIKPEFLVAFGFTEQRIYLPIIGIFIVFMEIGSLRTRVTSLKFGIIGLACIVFFSTITIQYSSNFKDKISFWESAVNSSPSSAFSYKHLGVAYQLDDRFAEAEDAYKKALEKNPTEPKVHNNLGTIFQTKGLTDVAEAEFLKEIEISPNLSDPYFHLGFIYFKEGKLKEAEEMWIKTLELNSEHLEAHRNLAIFYYEQKNFNNAWYHYNELAKRGVYLPDLLRAINSIK